MPNHVHVVIEPHARLPKITKSIKGFTARAANKIPSRTGEPFWQDESYDRLIGNPEERNRIIRYIERNPVSAGLVERPEEWAWSSAAGLNEHRQECLCHNSQTHRKPPGPLSVGTLTAAAAGCAARAGRPRCASSSMARSIGIRTTPFGRSTQP